MNQHHALFEALKRFLLLLAFGILLSACSLSKPPFPVAPRTSSEPLPLIKSDKAPAPVGVVTGDKSTATKLVPNSAPASAPTSASASTPLNPPNEQGEPLGNNQIRVVLVKGTISRKLLENMRKWIGNTVAVDPGDEPIPGKLIVLLDSRGGDGMAAMEIGKILRRNNAHVFVTGECSSACVFLLASGVVRGAPGFSVGIHQGRITMSSDTGTIKREVDVKEDPKARALLAQFERDAKVYFAQMGIPSSFFQAMQNHTTKGVYRLTGEEITFYGLSGFDEDYFDKRARFYAQKKGKWALDKDELHRRTAKVASECAPFEQKQSEFVSCYRRVLLDRY